jgi:hypothetical protein
VAVRKFPLFVAGAALLAAASAYRGFFDLFSYFAQYDDTGSMLAIIQGFNEHGGLYRETFSPYGPFFSEFYLFVGRTLSAPITHDGIRWIVLVLWVGSSIAGGAIAYRLTHRIWVALLVQALSFHPLDGLADEPGHPISLVAALLAAFALVVNWPRENKVGRVQAILAGTILGMLCMTKINLGLFAVAAAGTAWVYCSPRDVFGRALRWIAALLFCSFAVVLVGPSWPPETRLVFLTVFLCALIAVLVSARGGKMEWRVLGRFGCWALGALLLSVTLSLSGALFGGTQWADLIRGLIVQPMGLGGIYISLPDMQRKDAVIALASLIGACAWRLWAPASPLLERRISLSLRLVFVGLIAAWVMGRCAPWTALAFLWIAALPPPVSEAGQKESEAGRFGRLCLVLLAVGQVLGIYPVSGAQVAIPFFLASLCVIPVLHGLLLDFERADLFRLHPSLRFALPIALLTAPSLLLGKVWTEHVRLVTNKYHEGAPLRLPGTNLLRLERADAATCRCLAENLRNCRPSFVTLPGLNSLYGWAERPFPTGFNVPMNFALLSDEEQRKIVEVGRRCKPIALVLHQRLLFNVYIQGRYQASGPLVDFAKGECRPAGRVRGYDFMSLRNEPLPTLTYCATLDADSLPNESSRITVTLPSRFGKVTTASVLDLSAPKSRSEPLRLEERAHTRNESIGGEDFRQFTFVNPDPARLTLRTLNGFLVQLWDEAGGLVADLPFALVPEER